MADSPTPLPVRRFRLHGLRKLNWAERNGSDYARHMAAHGYDVWIEPGPLTIVVGPNGGGKSTVIDLFRALADASIWPGLARENYPGDDFSGFDVEGDEFVLVCRFSKYTPDAEEVFDKLTVSVLAGRGEHREQLQCLAPKYPDPNDWSSDLQRLLDRSVAVHCHCLPATGHHPGSDIDDVELVGLLNELSPHFPSVMANPQMKPFSLFRGAGDRAGRIGVLFKDDAGQHSFVHRTVLPLGWLQLASVLHFVRSCKPHSLILLDEPDRHLHPSLQRVLLELVAEESRRSGAQIMLATHSSVLVNPELCARAGARVIIVAKGRCEMLTDARHVLDDLGVTSGDLVQANGVIWVEGPSDRIYIKRWMELFAESIGESPFIERVHYAFVSYGGALLKHIGLSEDKPDRVNLRSVNRNFSVVIDRDFTGSEGVLGEDKRRLIQEASLLDQEDSVWVTERYTIESYLPGSWAPRRTHVIEDHAGRVKITGISKVDFARRFAEEPMAWEESFVTDSDLPSRIAALFARIRQWQSPQEVILPTYLPPWLAKKDEY
jgi:ABC-type branched-subunit amino acid transport system ATPase component